MDKIIGQESAKLYLKQLIAKSHINNARLKENLPTESSVLHSMFLGGPGTGKTSFARLMGEELAKLDLLESGHLIEVHRSDFVGQFQGETEKNTEFLIEQAIGGILFIDEAYSLYQGREDIYGKHIINILTKRMEDYKDDLMVVMAGYPDKMEDLLKLNPGLSRRIGKMVFFDDLNTEELKSIFELMVSERCWLLTNEAKDYAHKEIEQLSGSDPSSVNGGTIRNLVDRISLQQSLRLYSSSSFDKVSLSSVTLSDVTEDPHD